MLFYLLFKSESQVFNPKFDWSMLPYGSGNDDIHVVCIFGWVIFLAGGFYWFMFNHQMTLWS